ncbi:MAG: beta-glucosidase, partial [Prevotellaceae bacterium]|nr:beta-glucosidase [Prevotellaceae bacterium]
MKNTLLITATTMIFLTGVQAQNKSAKEIVAQMTLAEKVGQMAQISIDVITQGEDTPPTSTLKIDTEKLREAVVEYHVGSILNAPNTRARTAEWWTVAIAEMQKAAGEDRLQIPVLYGLDQIHGATYTAGSTLFPQEINLAASWNPAHARKMGEVAAYETRASNVPWTFSPVMDLGIDPRWSRQWEAFGEDPYLATVFVREEVKGLEGDHNDIGNP